MRAIEKAADALYTEYVRPFRTWTDDAEIKAKCRHTAKTSIAAFLDAILADPEAMERVVEAMREISGTAAYAAIEALKQEAER